MGSPERPMFLVVLGAITRRVVAGGMRGRAVGDELDQGRAASGARTLCRPFSDGIHRQEIVAVDADPGDAVPGPPCREGALLAARISLEGGDGPLIVHDVQDHRRLIHRGEQQRVVKIRFGARAFADPARGQMVLALECRRHRPADGLRELRGEIARNREQVPGTRVVHHRKLPALAHVARVRQQLAHHVDQRGAARRCASLDCDRTGTTCRPA